MRLNFFLLIRSEVVNPSINQHLESMETQFLRRNLTLKKMARPIQPASRFLVVTLTSLSKKSVEVEQLTLLLAIAVTAARLSASVRSPLKVS